MSLKHITDPKLYQLANIKSLTLMTMWSMPACQSAKIDLDASRLEQNSALNPDSTRTSQRCLFDVCIYICNTSTGRFLSDVK